MAGAVDQKLGKRAAEIIKDAQDRLVLTNGAAAKLAEPLTDVGWARVIRTGRGYPSTFVRMAKAVGVEAEVRDALGLPANVVPLVPPIPGEIVAKDVWEEGVLASPKASEALKRDLIEFYRAPGGGREIMAKMGIFPRLLDQARYGG
jgi:hypothetical protein